LNNAEKLVLNNLHYPNKLSDYIILLFIIISFVFGFFMVIFQDPEYQIGGKVILFSLTLFLSLYFIKYFFREAKVKDIIIVSTEFIQFNDIFIEVENLKYIAINFKDYRGRVAFKRNEFHLPRFGNNNEIKIQTNTGDFFESNFFVASKKERDKIDKYIHLWLSEGIRVDYLIDDELIGLT
jgi:hypothetical protein